MERNTRVTKGSKKGTSVVVHLAKKVSVQFNKQVRMLLVVLLSDVGLMTDRIRSFPKDWPLEGESAVLEGFFFEVRCWRDFCY